MKQSHMRYQIVCDFVNIIKYKYSRGHINGTLAVEINVSWVQFEIIIFVKNHKII